MIVEREGVGEKKASISIKRKNRARGLNFAIEPAEENAYTGGKHMFSSRLLQ